MGYSTDVFVLIAVLLFALAASVSQRIRIEIVAMTVLVALALTGLVTPKDALSGFSNPAVITVGAGLVVSAGLLHTGVAGTIGRGILRLAGSSEARAVGLLMATAGLLSAFMNNVAALAVLMPAAAEIAHRAKISPSRLLMPLSFASLLGGMTTLIGTPPNILASQYLQDHGLQPLSFFDFTAAGAAALAVGILYMSLAGRKLTPSRRSADDLREDLRHPLAQPEAYCLEERLFEVRIPEGSYLHGKSIGENHFRQSFKLTILAIARNGKTRLAPDTADVLRSGDMLLVKGKLEDIERTVSRYDLRIESGHPVTIRDLMSSDVKVVEVVLAPHSDLVGKTLREIQFRDKFGLMALAIWRNGKAIRTGVAEQRLEFGDALLTQGTRSNYEALRRNANFLLLELGYEWEERRGKAPFAVLILLAIVAVAACGLLPISMSMVTGAGLMIVTGCISPEEAYRSIDWRVILLVVGMLPAGIAMSSTGAARLLSDQIMRLSQGQPFLSLLGVLGLTMLLSQVIITSGSIVLMAPLALCAAQSIGADPRTYVLGASLASSMAFLTPLSHGVNMLVMGPGGYRFGDYARVGLPLSLLSLATIATVLLVT